MKTWTVYIRRNKINNKVYIGVTVKTPKQRAGQNGKWYLQNPKNKFARAIKKYGWDAFETNIIATGLNEKTALAYERFWIAVFDSYKNGYNSTPGGDCTCEESRKKHGEFMKGNQNAKGLKHTDEFKAWKSDQMREKYSNGGNPGCKAVEEIRDGKVVKKYFALSEAARKNGCCVATIYKHIKNGKPLNGSKWRYANND